MIEFAHRAAFAQAEPVGGMVHLGVVFAIGGSGSQVLLDLATLEALATDPDPVIAAGGQVGSQVKMRVGPSWLIASIRSLRLS